MLFRSAALDTLDQDPLVAHEEYLKNAHDDVAAKSTALKNWLSSIRGGKPWIGYMKLDEINNGAGLDDLSSTEKKIANSGSLKDKAQREFMQDKRFVAFGKSLRNHITAVQSAAPGTHLLTARLN